MHIPPKPGRWWSLRTQKALKVTDFTVTSTLHTHVARDSLQRTFQCTHTICLEFQTTSRGAAGGCIMGLSLCRTRVLALCPVSLHFLPLQAECTAFLLDCERGWRTHSSPQKDVAVLHPALKRPPMFGLVLLGRYHHHGPAQALPFTPGRGRGAHGAQLSPPWVSDAQLNPCPVKRKGCRFK